MNDTTNSAKDPRCPVCGNAVLGLAVYGNEGAYHPECTQAPVRGQYFQQVYVPLVPLVPLDMPATYNGHTLRGSRAGVN